MLPRTLLLVSVLVSPPDAPPSPAPRACHAAAATSAGLVIWGGARACGVDVLADRELWLWNGTSWAARPGPPIEPREDSLLLATGEGLTLTLLGGRRDGTATADVWRLQDGAWTELAAEGGPGAIQHGAAAFDPVRRRVVVFGGAVGAQRATLTHEWDGTRWLSFETAGPAPRVGHGMAWSKAEGAVLLYGGFADESFRDLWAWDGKGWKQLAADGPAFTEGHVITEAEEGVHVVGAAVEDPSAVRVWLWSKGRFEARGGSGPAPRIGATATWDRTRRLLLYWGGADAAGRPSLRLDEFDGTHWHLREATSPDGGQPDPGR